MAEFSASWTSGGGLKTSATLPVQQKTVQTQAKATFTCGAGTLPIQSASGSWSCQPMAYFPVTTPATDLEFRRRKAIAQAAFKALPTPGIALRQQSSQASMLGRYALWGALGLGATIIIYKLVKK